MRLTSIKISGFRGFAAERSLRLDADSVIVVGANGRGKTSLFDAVLWGLTGSVPRLPGNEATILSKYSASGEARVEISLRDIDAVQWRVIRRFDGTDQHVMVELPTGTERGAGAELFLRKKLWPESVFTSDSAKALTTALTRSVYLQQDVVREFIDSSADDAFRTISELVGTGRVTELQTQLERAKAAWSRVTNQRSEDLDKMRIQLDELKDQLNGEVTQEDRDRLADRWRRWWEAIREYELPPSGDVPPVGSPEAPAALNVAIRQLEAARHARERRRDLAAEILADVESHRETTEEPALLQAALTTAREELEAARAALAEAEHRASEARKAAVEHRQAVEEIRTLAVLALRHLDEQCPVCGQSYDGERTRARLEAIADQSGVVSTVEPSMEDVASLAGVAETRERRCSDLTAKLRVAEDATQQDRLWRARRDQRLREVGLEPGGDETLQELNKHLESLRVELARLTTLQEEGERLALDLARASEAARAAELEKQATQLRKDVAALEEVLKRRNDTGAVAGKMIEGLREAGSEIVKARLEGVDPLLQRLYASIDPHPSFKVVRVLARLLRGKGRVVTSIVDTERKVTSEAPGAILSSSQMNALAVTVFLALNLAVSTMPLELMMLDDPLQSLDDINLLGLVDLLRRVRERKQLFVSTHDARCALLLERKLRPVHSHESAHVIELQSWDREGPHVVERDVTPDASGLRIVA